MKLLLNAIFFLLLVSSCLHRKSTEVERVSVTPIEVNPEIESMMPGNLMLTTDYILWTNPFHADNNIHILDRETGKELGQMLPMGEGPDELVTPITTVAPGNRVYALDLNSKKQFLLSVDSALVGAPAVLGRYGKERMDMTNMSVIDDCHIIFLNPQGDHPFILTTIDGDSSTTFGKYPITERITNGYDRYQGPIGYHPQRELFLYSTTSLPYMALYKKEEESFRLINETPPVKNYDIVNGELRIETWDGSGEIVLTSDYIVVLKKDPKDIYPDGKRTAGRDFTRLPRTIFLYDYDLQLQKIIDLGMPVLRLAADPVANTLWFIGVNPDFALYKCEL